MTQRLGSEQWIACFRFFVRDLASAGTDIDFNLFLDTSDKALVLAVREFLKKEVKSRMKDAGLEMETDDYLMIDMPSYVDKFNDTRSSLFALANMNDKNTYFIAGSHKLHAKAFSFTNK
jgi:hypothetical protein